MTEAPDFLSEYNVWNEFVYKHEIYKYVWHTPRYHIYLCMKCRLLCGVQQIPILYHSMYRDKSAVKWIFILSLFLSVAAIVSILVVPSEKLISYTYVQKHKMLLIVHLHYVSSHLLWDYLPHPRQRHTQVMFLVVILSFSEGQGLFLVRMHGVYIFSHLHSSWGMEARQHLYKSHL